MTTRAQAAVIDAGGRSDRRRGQLAVVLAAVVWSTAGVMQRELNVDLGTQVAGRAFFAAIALAVFVMVGERRGLVAAIRGTGLAGLGFAACAATASISFIAALNTTTVANVLFVQAASPLMAALLAWIVLGEPISRRSWLAMLVALAGVGVMVGSPGNSAAASGLPILMAFSFSICIVIARHRREISMAPATCLAQIVILVVGLPFATTAGLDAHDLVLLFLLGAGQIGLGLALFTVGARLIPATEIAMLGLLEVVLGPLWVWLAVSERPSATTLAGGAVVVGAVIFQALSPGRLAPADGDPAAHV